MATRAPGDVRLPVLALALCCWLAVACTPLTLTRPVTKIGLVAPFEGPGRAQGYDAIFAARLALREANAADGASGWALELVALDDSGSVPLALRQVRALGADPDVTAAVHVTGLPVDAELMNAYSAAGIPVQFVGHAAGEVQPDPDFSRRYVTVSNGAAPTALSVRTYSAIREAIRQVSEQVRATGQPHRAR